jgi:hypothetical protein
VQINLAEAEYNLGRWREAMLRLSTRDWARAECFCKAAADHRYQGQGGDGLLLWGDVLKELGEIQWARRAYGLTIARDGQSESARLAAARLIAIGGADTMTAA